jgi:hypothetical protein
MKRSINHVYPLNDLREHVTGGTECWCKPHIDEIRENGCIVVHNAMDQRERSEIRGKADA